MALPNREVELWSKLVGLPLDRLAEEPAPEFGFLKRLMKSEKWDYATAVRVTAEYRRFLLLACLGPISPSPMVDAAWHLHLTYTRAYNVGLCERTLGRALDHNPSGGVADMAQYASLYEDTLNRYREGFGEEPPVDIWPGAQPALPGAGRGSRPIATALTLLLIGAAFLAIVTRHVALFVFLMFGAMLMALAAGNNRKRGDGSGCGGGGGCATGSDGGGGDGCGGGCGGGCS